LTQLTFGAACGEALLGPKVGRKALVWGTLLGTLPDLDVLIPLGGPVDDFVYHRGFSHSLALLALLAPLLAWVITRVHPHTSRYWKRWLLLCFLVLEAGVLLDFFTVYGTRILWPFDNIPRAWPVLFIVDPLFTLPLLFGALCALFLGRGRPWGHRLNTVGLLLGTAYLLWALGAGEVARREVRDKLARQGVSYSRLTVSPAPLTTLLWRVVGIDGRQYFETYHSLLDGDVPLFLTRRSRRLELLEGLEDHPPVVKLRWFTRGFYALERVDGHVVVTDLRMGMEPDYVFRFEVAALSKGRPVPMRDARLETRRDWGLLCWVWERIWTPVPPPAPAARPPRWTRRKPTACILQNTMTTPQSLFIISADPGGGLWSTR
jgi:inner membrane protein